MGQLDFSTRHLRYFVCTAELGQVSQAAQELNITQSAVTAAIKELESRLQTRLFDRRPGGMVLTDSGREFLNHCYQILNSVAACRGLNQIQETAGVLRVAATYTVLGYFLPFHLQRLRQLYPHLHIQLRELARVDIEAGLLAGDLDVAVLLSSNVHNADLAVHSFLDSKRHLWVGAGHRLLQQAQVDFADLLDEPYIMLDVDESAATTLAYWQQAGARPRVVLQTSSVEAVRSMVGNGSGISILSDTVYRPWSLEGQKIHKITLNSPVPDMSLGVAWRADVPLTPVQQLFCDYFIRRLG
ncbi:DNA-binding transcriptional LysR family regulator [Neisseria sp. HSC-16F19]|nr:LysR family transcriptional regulator [Neisseria sp. HSC-16F19]MCP2040012.1 DNA-binding transcriptional LysR family regulator [Neisseria sp. HSC-16F19]